ncbi:LamG-like jellyroll fold domain-containing protein [Nonomuraea sp. NPDC050663]|uniref:LamG-like jellyroll fold domain-containing protein n=1 Tax=Nonomuraea sp. NPDC050663 TaxID=3364370 RepID=UPI0037B5CD1C
MNEGAGSAVQDLSGKGNHGTITGATWAEGRYGRGLRFDGGTSVVKVPSSAGLKLSKAFTIEAWITAEFTDTQGPIVVKDASGRPAYGLTGPDMEPGDSAYRAAGYVTTNTTRKVASRHGFSPFSWQHLATTYDGQRLRVYINGALQGERAVSGRIHQGNGALRIGGYLGRHFNGLIDEVRIFSTARTTAQVKLDMNHPIVAVDRPPSQPTELTVTAQSANVQLGWTASTDDIGVRAYEIHRSTTPEFTPSAATWVGERDALAGTAFWDVGMPAGTHYYRVVALDTGSQASPPSAAVAVEVTVPGDPPSAPGSLVAGGRLDSAELRWAMPTAPWGLAYFRVHRSTTRGFTPTPRTLIATNGPALYTDSPLEAGTYYYRVIAIDYAGQAGPASNEASARVPDQPPGVPSVTATGGPGKATLSWTTPADDDRVTGYEVYRSRSSNAGIGTGSILLGTFTGTSLVDTGLSAGRHHYQVRAVDSAGQPGELSPSAAADVTGCPPADCLAAAYGMNEGTGQAVGDSSGKDNDGTATATTWADGKYGKALSFTTNASVALVPHAASLVMDDALTVEAWVYPTEISQTHPLVQKGENGTEEYVLHAARSNTGSPPEGPSGKVEPFYPGGHLVAGPTPLPTGTWSHVALTFGGGTMKLFVNGVQVAAAGDGHLAAIRPGTNPLRFGQDPYYGIYFKGLIDEVRIYSTDLSAEQIQADMARPV